MRQKVNVVIIIAGLAVAVGFLITQIFIKPGILTPVANSEGNIRVFNQSSVQQINKTDKPVSILLIGLDGRRGDWNPRCDAIHMVTIDVSGKTIKITSVPRGTEVSVPGVKNEYTYLSNSCHTYGIDYAVSQIQKITGVKNDYLVKLGFSQVLGALRILNFPASPLLQYLRNRSLPLGDYQRSHNQAVFIKDFMVQHFEKLSALPKSLVYLLYKLVDTDMDFDSAYGLYTAVSESQINKIPQNIVLVTKPSYASNIREMHFSPDGEKNDWQEDQEYKDYQKNLEEYLNDLVTRSDRLITDGKNTAAYSLVKTPFNQKIWEQLDNERRNKYHYDLLRIYVMTATDMKTLPSLVLDYIAETEALKETEWQKKGEELLETISK